MTQPKLKKSTPSRKFVFTSLVAVALACLAYGSFSDPYAISPQTNAELAKTSVMVVRADERGGGTGSIYSSSPTGSMILTNGHVCKAVAKGGTVITSTGDHHNVIGYKMSDFHDICGLYVAANLHVNTELAADAPALYSDAIVSGHPSLLPNIVTRGHFSERRLVDVNTGFRKCTTADIDAGNGLMCLLLGGIPEIKHYEAQVISATIMPGSSGSAVYNANGKLSALVFAGAGNFGYGITVPYEAVAAFIHGELALLPLIAPTATDPAAEEQESARNVAQKACATLDLTKEATAKSAKASEIDDLIRACKQLEGDAVWKI